MDQWKSFTYSQLTCTITMVMPCIPGPNIHDLDYHSSNLISQYLWPNISQSQVRNAQLHAIGMADWLLNSQSINPGMYPPAQECIWILYLASPHMFMHNKLGQPIYCMHALISKHDLYATPPDSAQEIYV